MSRAVVEQPYDFVTLLIGVNDQYQGVAAAAYLDRFQKVLADAIGLAGDEPSRVIVLSIPDYSVTPFASHMDTGRIRAEIDRFNVLNREAARVAGVHGRRAGSSCDPKCCAVETHCMRLNQGLGDACNASLLLSRAENVGIEFRCAFGAQPVAEFGVGVLADVRLDPLPVTAVVADALAV